MGESEGEIRPTQQNFGLSDAERLTNEAIAEVTMEDWISRVRNAEQLQEKQWHKEIARDEVTQRGTINLGDESDDPECGTIGE